MTKCLSLDTEQITFRGSLNSAVSLAGWPAVKLLFGLIRASMLGLTH